MLEALERDARGPDPRPGILRGLLLARLDLAQGLRDECEERLAGLPFPLESDLPELTLQRWYRETAAHLPEAAPPPPAPSLAATPPLTPALPPEPARRDAPDLVLDLASRTVSFRGRTLDFRRRERMVRLLVALLRAPGRLIPLEELVETVWERRYLAYETDGLVHTAISRLRRVLGSREVIVEELGAYGLSPRGSHRLLGLEEAPARLVPGGRA
jgi:hypothetical protein